ncbi:hypothetical protein [Corynebacterium antarcticum]|uniref:hypothetical protein n=1 Tax=Corynebacterium antarcticum TaxID=2800405 RepID=UPI002004BF96|nr:hypothetical protein [Corynebacterium antarcticum]MCK7661182.1 hypothetical protein [Corynebacterium antarcticum]
MPDTPYRSSSRRLRFAAALTATVLLAGCGGGDGPEPGQDADPADTTEGMSTASATSTTDSGGSGSPTSTTSGAFAGATDRSPRLPRSVQDAYERFGTLAPRSLFEKFDSCMPNGVADSSACSGEEVGQFQFFANEAKAASTTQLLTELRSARIVQDDGDVIVGWSNVGTVAIITVVDNANGVVLQQMISTDEQDPRERIMELGLARRTATTPPRTATSTRPTGQTTGTGRPTTPTGTSTTPTDRAKN